MIPFCHLSTSICMPDVTKQLPTWHIHMGESFQDYSWIQDFEADFP